MFSRFHCLKPKCLCSNLNCCLTHDLCLKKYIYFYFKFFLFIFTLPLEYMWSLWFYSFVEFDLLHLVQSPQLTLYRLYSINPFFLRYSSLSFYIHIHSSSHCFCLIFFHKITKPFQFILSFFPPTLMKCLDSHLYMHFLFCLLQTLHSIHLSILVSFVITYMFYCLLSNIPAHIALLAILPSYIINYIFINYKYQYLQVRRIMLFSNNFENYSSHPPIHHPLTKKNKKRSCSSVTLDV